MEDKTESHENTFVLPSCRSEGRFRRWKFHSVEYNVKSDSHGTRNEGHSPFEPGLAWGSQGLKEAEKS